ncbi:holo-ACP synthase [Brevibacillus fulvus]|uniref:Holo-[acyl-carrier-protein] synthase n=1 Tax=Brevibacillus fulvus TaxID=1125967 RepID=A0A938XWQ6_9BACL|nr:holo-ACP synthase [Brevibacillus fulvus]MBM7591592.1 holo-[acyl-carrier protein] synthase [Brevibacillus fulvus]
MIAGIGIDIVEIERIAAILQRNRSFLRRILTEQELAVLPAGEQRLVEYVAGRFAAKEATVKALGTGIGSIVGFHDIEIQRTESGKPMLLVARQALQKVCSDPAGVTFHLSISHSKAFAVAQVVMEKV